MVLLVFIMTSG